MAVAGPRYRGWKHDAENARLDFFYNGTRSGHINATAAVFTGTLTVDGAVTSTGALTASSTIAGAGDITLTGAGIDFIALAGSARLGSPAVFATTQGQGVVHMGGSSLSGVAPVGATVTSGGLFASDTVCRKIIADATASNVET